MVRGAVVHHVWRWHLRRHMVLRHRHLMMATVSGVPVVLWHRHLRRMRSLDAHLSVNLAGEDGHTKSAQPLPVKHALEATTYFALINSPMLQREVFDVPAQELADDLCK